MLDNFVDEYEDVYILVDCELDITLAINLATLSLLKYYLITTIE